MLPRHTIKGNAIVLKISKAAVLAAVLSLSAVPAIGLIDAVAEETTTTSSSGFTSNLSIPTITAVDSSMDEAALRDALSGGFSKHVDELAKLTATSIAIPEITLTMTVTPAGGAAPVTTTAKYTDLVLSNVKDGVAASVSIGSAESTTKEGSFKFGKMSTGLLDIGGILALYSLVPGGSADAPMKTLYKDFAFEGGSFSGPEVSCTFGKVTADEFDARPLKVSFAALMEAAGKMEAAKENPPPEAIATFVSFMTDIFQAFKSTPLNMDGLTCTGTAEGKPLNFSIGGLTMDGYAPGLYPAIAVHDIKFKSGDEDSFTLAEAKFKSTDLSGPIAAVNGNAGGLNEAWFTTNYRKLIPAWGGFSFSGLALDVPNPDKPSERYQAKVADFDLTLSDYLNGIPTKLSTTASGVEVPLPTDSTDDSVKMLKAIGITSVNLNYEVSASWDKANQSINVDKVAVSGNDLGSFAIATVIGNATETLFDIDPNVEQAAAMGVTVKSVKIDIKDAGLEDKMIPLLAAQQGGADPTAFRKAMAAQAEGAAIAMLGSTDSARQLGAAVSDFILGGKKALTIGITAKDPSGIAVPVFMQASNDPTVLASAVDITGSAE